MGYSSELHIEMHNQAMETEENYAAEYFNHWIEELMSVPEDYEYESDYRIDFKGYEEFLCPLCCKFADNDFAHKECIDDERAWDAAASEAYDDELAWR